jgi:molybdenum cofactor synthesis domain-containing protein
VTIKIGIINVSDRASKGIYEDIPGQAIVSTLNEYLTSSWQKEYAVVPDEQTQIEKTLIEMADEKQCCLIVTCGGTGPAKRDVTPEATEAVCDKMMPGFGEHISAFTLIWVATTLWYTWYSMKQMDTSAMANPAMKYMQYFMPLMFMFFFNSFASGLTLYLCFSNILNIGQTVVTKAWLINHDKIKAELEANRNKPKKTTGFRAKLENAMKEAQKQQDERNKQSGTKKK